jgi:hypothetical protein
MIIFSLFKIISDFKINFLNFIIIYDVSFLNKHLHMYKEHVNIRIIFL